MIGGDWRQVLVTALTPALGYDAWSGRFQMLRHRMGLAPAPPPATDWTARDRLTMDPAVATSAAEALIARQSEHLDRIAYYDGSVSRRSERALARMHRRIRANGGTMILVVPPMTEAVRTQTERALGEQVRGFEAMTGRLAADGVVVSDHWRDPAFGRRYDLFADNQHLNGAGAEAFSRSLALVLRDRGVLPAAACDYPKDAGPSGFPTTFRSEMLGGDR